MSRRTPKVLYHYCTLETFHSIITNRSIWLSDISKSNDSQELKWIKGQSKYYILKAWVDYLEALKADGRLSEAQFDKYEEIEKIIDSFIDYETEKCWVFCVTEKKDDLGQWRGYAKDGTGISIGFKSRFLDGFNKDLDPQNWIDSHFTFEKVEYTQKAVQHLFYDICHLSDINTEMTCEQVLALLKRAAVFALLLSPFYKNEGFKEEKEWRLTRSMTMNELRNGNTPDVLSSESSLSYPMKYEYSVKNGTLVSHIDISYENLHEEIAEICIGPKCPLSVSEVKLFLISTKMLKDFNDQSIKVYRSSASYR